jgi:hypothetical protein
MLFPKCTFNVMLPESAIWSGTRTEGTLELTATEDIPRAEHADLDYTVEAVAGYGSGKSRNVIRRTLFSAPLQVPLEHVLKAGTHRFPFAIDLPAWVPPAYIGDDCGIYHRIKTRLDVSWAIDPKAILVPRVIMAPGKGSRRPLVQRSPHNFHESIVLEIALATAEMAANEAISGQIALRAGRDARFDAVLLSLEQMATVTMGRGDVRRKPIAKARIPADAIRAGEPITFSFPADHRIVPSFRNPFIDNDLWISVKVDIPWARDPEFFVPLRVLPAGSQMHGDASYAPVGGQRLRLAAATIAKETGLTTEGTAPVLVEGNIGPVRLRVSDAPREGAIGLETELVFPDIELGTTFKKRGALDGFRDNALLRGRLSDEFLLRTKRDAHAPPFDDEALARFYGTVLSGFEKASELRLSDHHVAAHFALIDDDTARIIELAEFLRKKTEAIGSAIDDLPFPKVVEASRPTWKATAAEQEAVLIPTGPSIHGLTFGAALLDGSTLTIRGAIRTVWTEDGPHTRVELDLSGAPAPEEAAHDLEAGHGELAATIHQAFPMIDIHRASATFERPGFTADPRTLLGTVGVFLSWLLEARGERRAEAPYR